MHFPVTPLKPESPALKKESQVCETFNWDLSLSKFETVGGLRIQSEARTLTLLARKQAQEHKHGCQLAGVRVTFTDGDRHFNL
jgi:hypothetical protein